LKDYLKTLESVQLKKGGSMMEGSIIGFDIGGSNIKFAVITPCGEKYVARGGIVNAPFMSMELEHIVNQFLSGVQDDISHIGVITSYPVSCGDQREGMEKIVNLFQKVMPEKPVFFIDFESRMWPLQEVISADPARFAMSNFFGSAYLGSKIRSNTVVMDTGSTSTDILLIRDNCPVAIGQDTNSIGRQLTGEMTWTGVLFTPVSSLTEYVPLRGRLVKGNPRGGTANDVYNIIYYEKMRDLLGTYEIKQKEKDRYALNLASLFLCDLKNIGPDEIENAARYVSVKHVEVVAGFLLQVLSYHKMHVKDTDFVLMGIGKDILLKKVLNLLDVDQSRIFDAADYIPGDLWAHGSSVGAALRTLDHAAGEHVPLSAIEGVKT
jgi:uncharacterized hydantoinase/oxoprolinase family protein